MQVPGFQYDVQDLRSVFKCFHRIANDGIAPVSMPWPLHSTAEMCAACPWHEGCSHAQGGAVSLIPQDQADVVALNIVAPNGGGARA